MTGRGGSSVVIPTYERAQVVGRAIRSALIQQDEDLEVIVVDDGSTDGTREVLAGFDDRRLDVVRQSNGGRCAARNAGARRAFHDWLIFLDSDDELLPGALASFARGRAAGAALVVAPTDRRLPEGGSTTGEIQWDDKRRIPWGLQAGAFAIDRRLLDEIGGYCTALEHSEHTEMAFCLRRIAPPPIVHRLSAPTVTVRERKGGYEPDIQYRTATHLLTHMSEEMASDRVARANYLGIAGEAASRLGRRAEGVSLIGRSFLTRPSLRTAVRSARALVRPAVRPNGGG